ncbi:hypothetical protein [Tautonia marina]|uniref:hypothetical protein n=1 Tax=Tautonia marina TaxID=2653855 RepID=UPI0012609B5A|nr:hypothetical protein [Tautonia marina]
MALKPSEMVSFFGEQTKRTRLGMAAAQSSGNYQLAAMNCRQAFKCRLMKSLIEWRMGIDPSDSLSEVVEGFVEDWAIVLAVGADDADSGDVPAERVAFVAYLVGKPRSIDVLSANFECDRLLDLVLGNWLFSSWDCELWEKGMKQLRQAGSDLAVRTYELYKAITNAAASDLPALSQEGESLFAKRKADGFFRGGDQTEGGGDDNNITIDYRLAAILKRSGFVDEERVHVWKW